ncbi:exonuclease SbcCD subunit D [Bogoriella caseilytica]|uniref:Nuclease SbcCD subunit D n=1 Tax=Bogoriella caseilytica TaxID=56055 RepID=A0A3N2BET6_9MICO|nr:exonuclease SbcCD subunit D [Bogoriella caseilytica]ROR73757.1 exodeoxyribonuclease I subunit D [Bogoriella caseilytica]
MRILHTSDWHLGRTLHGASLATGHETFLDHLLEVVREESVDAVLVAGDVYDRAIPPVESVELLSDALARLTALTRVVVTPGNHDSATRLGFGAHLYRDRVALRARVADIGEPVELPDAQGDLGAYVYALPYLDPDMCRGELTDEDNVMPARSHEAVTAAAMRRVRADLSARRAPTSKRRPAVAMAHAFVTGGAASDSERDIRVGGVDSVPSGVFAGAGLDYAALGHLHGPQQLGRHADEPLMRYSGSPLAFSFSERHHVKSSALIELGSGGVERVELIETPVLRPLSELRGTLAELLSAEHDDRTDDWIKAIVTDPVRPEGLYSTLKKRFPHLLVGPLHEPEGVEISRAAVEIARQASPDEVAGEFLAAVGGRPAAEEELAVVREVYEQLRQRSA